jgi:hypothetical protein
MNVIWFPKHWKILPVFSIGQWNVPSCEGRKLVGSIQKPSAKIYGHMIEA